MFRSAFFSEQFALCWLQNTFKYFSALRRLRVSHARIRDSVALLGVPRGIFVANAQCRLRDESEPAPLKIRPQLEDFGHYLERRAIAPPRHYPLILILDPGFARMQLPQKHNDGLEQIQRLEARGDDWLTFIPRNPLIRPTADHRRNVSRSNESVETHVWGIEDGADRRDDRDVIAEDREITDALSLRAHERQRSRGRRRLESDRKEHDLPLGIFLRQFQCIRRRVHDTHIGPSSLMLEWATVRSRHAHHVTKSREDDVPISCNGQPIIDSSHRQNADRTTRPMDQFNI